MAFSLGKLFWLLLALILMRLALPLRSEHPHRIGFLGMAVFFFGAFVASFGRDVENWVLGLIACWMLAGLCLVFVGGVLSDHQRRHREETPKTGTIDETIQEPGRRVE